jgi:hypothetical protein
MTLPMTRKMKLYDNEITMKWEIKVQNKVNEAMAEVNTKLTRVVKQHNIGQKQLQITCTYKIYIQTGDFFSCDVEQDARQNSFCRLRQCTNDQFDWTRQSGRTPTGARFDRRLDFNQVIPEVYITFLLSMQHAPPVVGYH